MYSTKKNFLTFSMFSSVRSAERRPERHHLLPFFPRLNKKPLKNLCSLHGTVTDRFFFCASDAAFPSLKQNLTQMRCQPFENRDTHLFGTTINTRPNVIQSSTAAKLTRLR
jgi:hypothetical protein